MKAIHINVRCDEPEALSRVWAIGRRKSKRGSTYPVRFHYKVAVSGAEVVGDILRMKVQRSEDFKAFSYADIWPVEDQLHA